MTYFTSPLCRALCTASQTHTAPQSPATSRYSEYLHLMLPPRVPSTEISSSHHLSSQLPFPVLLPRSHSQFPSPSLVSNVSLPGFSPNLPCMPTPCPLGIQIIPFLGFPSTGKMVEIAECGLPVPEHSSYYYLPREQNLKCGALEGVEMSTLGIKQEGRKMCRKTQKPKRK